MTVVLVVGEIGSEPGEGGTSDAVVDWRWEMRME